MKPLKSICLVICLCVWSATSAGQATSLYDELGQQAGIDALMTKFVLAIAEDERVVDHFRNVDIDRFHRMIGQHICALAGGPCVYQGASMTEVHRGMAISRSEFNAIVENLIAAMEQQQLAVGTQNKLLAKLAAFQADIVQ
ncbi:group I truncated hemoglobin [Pseudidiomarina sediminum]|uniref:group I truncated hemoglobin n=1 Tax=Pseudidiomarina sediminum TaxID=431675 RepID=UPI001C97C2CC|nr:group 1 truncated hemoglobin [Pseudidiomarina sediminum]MBY6063409.1 group 1 truncated hemoglobin [Pseudidiomarina sediminum]